MINSYDSRILILGSNGLIGQTVYQYLKNYHPTWATTKNPSDPYQLKLSCEYVKNDFEKIANKMQKIDYVINCIGVFNNVSFEDMTNINADFPHNLEALSEVYKFKLIHISTDAVFPENAGEVNEDMPTRPYNDYGVTKLKGETTSKRAITFRSSFLGFDQLHKKGLFEKILKQTNITIDGYTNQLWSGCTTLQFAQLCHFIIQNSLFNDLRILSPIFHFAPISKTTKYNIIKTLLSVKKNDVIVRKIKSKKITRFLTSKYNDMLFYNQFRHHPYGAITELTAF